MKRYVVSRTHTHAYARTRPPPHRGRERERERGGGSADKIFFAKYGKHKMSHKGIEKQEAKLQ